jgi:putative toxin-antitoxin system antitoxin component (TIGR02293 family)
MSPRPLAELYERLKEMRRQGGLPEGLSERPTEELARALGGTEISAGAIRNLEIRVLAERIFGDDAKAEAWLNRPNPSLSGQKPVDLLSDELGAAVVRETLEQIDHGIFA